MFTYGEGILLITSIIISVAILFIIRIPVKIREEETLYQRINRSNRSQRLESYNHVRSIFINILAGFVASILLFNFNLSFYKNDITELSNSAIKTHIFNKYQNYNEFKLINDINHKIVHNESNLASLKKNSIYIYVLLIILGSSFIYTIYEDLKKDPKVSKKKLFGNMLNEFSICILAYGLFLSIVFEDINNYIFAISISILSFLLMALGFFIKKM